MESIVSILTNMTEDWEVGDDLAIGSDTKLVADLEFASVDIIHLCVAIEEHFKCPKMGFQKLLMKDNRYVDDLSVSQVVAFVASKLAGETQ